MQNLYWPKGRLWRSESRKKARRVARWRAAESQAEEALVVSHGNCLDGVAAAVVTLRALGPGKVGTCFVQPGDMAEVLGYLSQFPGRGRRLLVADLSLQPVQLGAIVAACRALRQSGWIIEWRDHHHKQWEGLDLAPLRAELAVLEVNSDASESGASLQQQALAPGDAFLRELAEKVRDRDLWWNKDPDSETLEFALSDLGTKDFMAHLLASGTTPVVDERMRAAAQRERDLQKAVLDRLLAGTRHFGEGPTRVGIVYGWLPKNTGLHELIDAGCQIAVNVRPNGKMSLRSKRGADVCHIVAREFSGGGHPNASGGDLGLKGARFWWYVLRRGRVPVVERLAKASVRELQALAESRGSGMSTSAPAKADRAKDSRSQDGSSRAGSAKARLRKGAVAGKAGASRSSSPKPSALASSPKGSGTAKPRKHSGTGPGSAAKGARRPRAGR